MSPATVNSPVSAADAARSRASRVRCRRISRSHGSSIGAVDHQVGAHPSRSETASDMACDRWIVRRSRSARGNRKPARPTGTRLKPSVIGMARADDFAFDSERLTQADVQSVGQHDQPRGDFFAVRQRRASAVRCWSNGCDLGVDRSRPCRNFSPHRVDQRVVDDSVLVAGARLSSR